MKKITKFSLTWLWSYLGSHNLHWNYDCNHVCRAVSLYLWHFQQPVSICQPLSVQDVLQQLRPTLIKKTCVSDQMQSHFLQSVQTSCPAMIPRVQMPYASEQPARKRVHRCVRHLKHLNRLDVVWELSEDRRKVSAISFCNNRKREKERRWHRTETCASVKVQQLLFCLFF